MSMTSVVWSPEAVASSKSSDENSKSIIEFICGRKVRYACENPFLSPLAESSNLIPPSSSPTATRLFAAHQSVNIAQYFCTPGSPHCCMTPCRKEEHSDRRQH